MNAWRAIFVACLLLPARSGLADDSVSLTPVQYAIVDMAHNEFLHAGDLDVFFEKLKRLEHGKLSQVRVVHIGDSHLQADLFSGPFRRSLQRRFGNAGRGMVTAYQAVGTTNPEDLVSASNVRWNLSRVVAPHKGLPVGVSGMTLWTRDERFLLKVGINPEESSETFDTVRLFVPDLKTQYDWRLAENDDSRTLEKMKAGFKARKVIIRQGDSLGHIALRHNVSVADLRKWNKLKNDLIFPGHSLKIMAKEMDPDDVDRDSFRIWPKGGRREKGRYAPLVFELDRARNYAYFAGHKSSRQQREARLYGISLEKRHAQGLLYHTIGVNGARAWHYIQDRAFAAQVRALKPDLVILSLGTNEAIRYRVDGSDYRQQLQGLAVSVAEEGVPVLITTPPDTLQNGKGSKRNNKVVWGAMEDLARAQGFALWPFHQIMGGFGSMDDWSQAGLAQGDHVHLSRKGYRMQGKLLFEAFMEAYGNYGKR